MGCCRGIEVVYIRSAMSDYCSFGAVFRNSYRILYMYRTVGFNCLTVAKSEFGSQLFFRLWIANCRLLDYDDDD